MGIGVYESSQYVAGIGGQMAIDSAPGAGTRVRVLLPAGDDADAPAEGMEGRGVSAAGPSQGRSREQGEAKARRARLRARAAADPATQREVIGGAEAANNAPSGGSAAARAASVGVL